MTRIALETSSRPPSVAVQVGDTTLARSLEAGRRHASDLLGALESMLDELGQSAADIQAVVVGTGPGSYTGLRVGIATALGLSRGSGAQLQTVPSFDALALAHLDEGECGTVLLDARSQQIYGAHYERTATGLLTRVAPVVCAIDAWRSTLPAGDWLLCDEAGAEAAGLVDAELARRRPCSGPHAEHVLVLGIARLKEQGALSPEAVEPLYLRPFAANVRKR